MSENIGYDDIAVKDIHSLNENTLQAIERQRLGRGIPSGYTRRVRTVGQNIAQIRERLGISQIDLADRLKMRQPSLWKLENSKGLPEGATLLKVATALPCTVEDLLAGVDAAYDKIRNDLTRHTGTGQRTPHQPGESDVPASARVLEDRRRRDEQLAEKIKEAASALFQIATSLQTEVGGATQSKTRGQRGHRKAG